MGWGNQPRAEMKRNHAREVHLQEQLRETERRLNALRAENKWLRDELRTYQAAPIYHSPWCESWRDRVCTCPALAGVSVGGPLDA